jgi:DNA-binding LytR/AlgR family response regulator
LLFALFMAAFGAFQSEDQPWALRHAYWTTVMLGGGVIAALIEPGLERVPGLAPRPWLLAAAQALVMTPPITLFVWLVSGLMYAAPFTATRLVGLLPTVLLVDIAVVILAWLIRRGAARLAPAAPATSDRHAPPGLAEKLPPRLARAELLAVQAEDHYLRVQTAAGEALILMRFSDALEALDQRPGVRVHRSWWVATAAVDHTRWSRGRGELTLRNGVRVPVSRTYAAAVKQQAWT